MDLSRFQQSSQQPSPAGQDWLERWLEASYPGPAMDPHVSGKEAERNRPHHPRHLEIPRLRRLAVAPKRNRPANEHLLCSRRSLPFRIPSSQQPGDRLPSPHHHHQAMELFPDGGFVRLQSRGNRNKYVHADGDWFGVSLRPLGTVTPLEAVWRVEHLPVNQEVIFLLLQNAAYGRYLSFSPFRAQPGHRGRRAVQADRNEPPNHVLNAYLWWWRAERVDPNQDYVRLRYADSHFLLRANGRHLTWNTGVTVARNRRRRLTTMMQWTVHLVPASPVPLPLPVAPPQPLQIQGGHRGLLFRRRTGNRGPGVYQHPARTIGHVRANDEGEFNQDHRYWPAFASYDHSVINLRAQMGQLQGDWNGDMLGFTLCIRPGSHGRLMPLVTDLPRSLDPMYIVVFRTGSPGAAALVYPQIDTPAQ